MPSKNRNGYRIQSSRKIHDFKNTKLYTGHNPHIQMKIEELRRLSNHSMRTYKMLEKLNTSKKERNHHNHSV